MKRLPLSLVFVFLLACKKDPPPPPPPAAEPVDAAPPSAKEATVATGGLAKLECEGIRAASASDASSCAEDARPTDALVAFSEKLTELFALHHPPPDAWWAPARAALDAAKDADPKSMTFAERVTVQNAALHLAVSAKGDLARDALKLVDRLAFTPVERDKASSQEIDMRAWLGDPATRVERTKTAPFLHEHVHHQTRVFRMVRTATLRANFSELIAVDTDGAPFTTNVVGSLEIRKGTGLAAPACVALQSPALVRCGALDGLRAVDKLEELPQSHFLRRDERGELRCNDCHGAGGNEAIIGAIDLGQDAVATDLARRRRATLARLRPVLDAVRTNSKKP